MTIAEQFESYKAEVMPPKADRVQVTECKRAFFAGAQAYRAACMKIAGGIGATDDIAGGRAILALKHELDLFCGDVLAGLE